MTLATEAAVRPLHQASRLRVLVTSGDVRSPFFPDVPTFREAGVDLVQREWYGAFMPPRTTDVDLRATAQAARALLEDPEARETWERNSLTMEAGGPSALSQAMRAEHAYWARMVRASGFTPER